MERTKEMWTPRERWRPAQVRQMKVPNLGEAHCGEGAEQSMQVLLGGRDWRVVSCGGELVEVGKEGKEHDFRIRKRFQNRDRVIGEDVKEWDP